MENNDNPLKKITPGRHSGRQKGGKRGLPNPQSLAAQGIELGRHWVDGGALEQERMPFTTTNLEPIKSAGKAANPELFSWTAAP